jgi:N-succinyldiaminopimelate aminotransferase
MAPSAEAGQKHREQTCARHSCVLPSSWRVFEPKKPLINLSVGEPRHAMPAFVAPVIATHIAGFAKYPMLRGTDRFRTAAVANWLGRRYKLPRPLRSRDRSSGAERQPRRSVLRGPCRKAIARRPRRQARDHGAEPVLSRLRSGSGRDGLRTGGAACRETRNQLYSRLQRRSRTNSSKRTVAIYLCSPANPQGSVLPRATLETVIARARKHGTFVFADECYSEIWLGDNIPTGALEACRRELRQRSCLLIRSRSARTCPACAAVLPRATKSSSPPTPNFATSQHRRCPNPCRKSPIAAYSDEYHVEDTRKLYREKFDLADRLLAGKRYKYHRPDGGFFLWLDVTELGDDETAAKDLFKDAGLRVVPGSYLARTGSDGKNPGANYIRVALVDDLKITEEALSRLASFRK